MTYSEVKMMNELKKTKSRSEIKREQILHSAIELFCIQGFPNTSMDEVAKLAGVSKQTVYAHFGSKDDLFVAAIESRCIAHQLTGNLLFDPKHPEVSILRFSRQFGEMIVSHETMAVFKTCVAQAESHPELPRLFFNAGPKHVLGLLSGFLQQVDKQGAYHFPKPHDSAIRLCLMLFGELKLRLELGLEVEELRLSRDAYIEETAQMFLRAHRV
jgi:TetR/AcrR family transcriptional regulator, mexJK operon transcriptional repressor